LIIPILVVVLVAAALVVATEAKLNNRLHRQLRNEQRAYFDMRERAEKAESELAHLRRIRKSQ
jgi:hypothetical protein